ncbi:hypothetical protein AB5J55_43885 [Streptomyces sp. R11]|uniref:ABC transporter permease n=1 Tax=Streptomyces sp. R11 TaxID=3238625 RepID=A0AB39NE69_9ACTN
MNSVIDPAVARAELIKLRTIPSTWWFLGVTSAAALTISGLVGGMGDAGDIGIIDAMIGPSFSLLLIMILAARAATQEFQTNVIWASYLAVPNWPRLISTRAATLATVSAVVGAAICAGSLLVVAIVAPDADLVPDTSVEWRALWGLVLAYAISAVIGMSVGIVIKSGGLATSLLLVWSLAGEPALGPLSDWLLGSDLSPWLPFTAMAVIIGDSDAAAIPGGIAVGVFYVMALACALLAFATAVQRRRQL